MTPPKLRARELGLPLAERTGKHNAITDIPGVLAGFITINRDRDTLEVGTGPVHTSVTQSVASKSAGDTGGRYRPGSYQCHCYPATGQSAPSAP